jgi:hypothetical protein
MTLQLVSGRNSTKKSSIAEGIIIGPVERGFHQLHA